jgi:hypothetical protein
MEPDKKRRLIQLLGMMGSAHDGECLNAARLAQRLIGAEELTWEEVLSGTGNSGGGAISFNRGYQEGYRRGLAEGHAGKAKPVTWTAFARTLLDGYQDDLSDWEIGFVENYIERGWAEPTPKQRVVFTRIADKLDLDCP